MAATGSNISLQLTGTLAAPLNGFSRNLPFQCKVCLSDGFYDLGFHTGKVPIEFSPSLDPTAGFNAPTPMPLAGGNGTLLAIPSSCGGDQARCETTGYFPTGRDFNLTSGTYTSLDVTAHEPGSVIELIPQATS